MGHGDRSVGSLFRTDEPVPSDSYIIYFVAILFNIQLYSYTVLFLGVSCPLFMILLIYIFIYILIIKYFQKNGGSKNKLYIV